MVPILRAGQQLQVVTKLLELCNLPASGHKRYADLLPCWTHYSTTSPVHPSPITFSKLHIEVMIQKRDDYYRRMQEELGDFAKKFELFPGQVSCFFDFFFFFYQPLAVVFISEAVVLFVYVSADILSSLC